MRRIIKFFVILILLVLVGLVSLPFVIPVETLKNQAVAQIEKLTGRKVSMGKVSLSVFPNIALSADDVKIGQPEWVKGSDAMAQVKNLRIGVELMPLLQKDIHVTDISLDTPSIHLVKNGEKANWQFNTAGVAQAKENAKEEAKAEDRSEAAPAKKGAAVMPLRLDSFSISNGTIVFEDSASGTKQSLAQANVKLSSKDLPKSLTLKGDAVYNGTKTAITLSLGSPFEISEGGVSNVDLKASMNDISVDWVGTLAMKAGKPTITGTVKLPELNTTKGAAEGKAGGGAAAPASSERWSSAPISMQPLSAANADVNVEIGKLVLTKMTLDNVKAHVKLNNGALSADVDEMKLFSGAVKLAVTAQAAGAAGIKASMTNVQVEELLQTLAQSNVMTGVLTGDVNLNMRGNSQRAMVSSLDGTGSFDMKDGSYRGGNFLDMTRNIATSFQRGTNAAGKTDFKELSGTFNAKDGVFFNEDLKMTGTLLSLTGKGQIDLPQWLVHYMVTPVVITNRGSETSAASGITVPVKIEGNLDSPSYHPDLSSALQEGLKNPEKLKENLQNIKGDLKDIKKGLSKEGLQNLLR